MFEHNSNDGAEVLNDSHLSTSLAHVMRLGGAGIFAMPRFLPRY
jgi:hypothetical protein